jgi:putative polymerase
MTLDVALTSRKLGAIKSALVLAPVFAALLFNMLLCFLNTIGFAIASTHVVLAEIAILGATLSFVARRIPPIVTLGALVFTAYLAALWLFSDRFDPEALRDLLIPLAFYFLGSRFATAQDADRLVRVSVLLVLAVGIFEWGFLDLFLHFFNVMAYYVARGTVDAVTAAIYQTDLFASGIRPEAEGRTLLPFLGDHRVSSVFLEPVSAGNFAVIAFAWFLVRGRDRWRKTAVWLALCLCIIILADSRLGLIICLATLALLVPTTRKRWVYAVAPACVVAVLIAVSSVVGDAAFGDNLLGRLTSSGSVLNSYGLEWLGLKEPAVPPYDSGYAYVLTKFGLVGAIALWIVFLAMPRRTAEAEFMKAFNGYYMCLLLSVSGSSLFTIKTGALLWFIFGAAQHASPLVSIRTNSNLRRFRLGKTLRDARWARNGLRPAVVKHRPTFR